jgi:hypothetical protein
MALMPIDRIPDWEQRIARQDAFWQRAIIDRPVVIMACGKATPEVPWPAERSYPTERERWFDVARVVEGARAAAVNIDYLGDSLPTACPNLGPEIFSAFFGTELEYSRDTAWAVANLEDWSEVDKLRFTEDNFYYRKLWELTEGLLAGGNGLYYTGLTDFHPGGDAIVAFRDPLYMNMDMLEAPEEITTLLAATYPVYFDVFDRFYNRLREAGQACTAWAGVVSSQKWYVPSNDFSCMISKDMFDEFFLPGIAEECRQLQASIYHLDGPDALRHLDSLLAIPELNAIQWVYGAGNGRASDWLPVYQKCQAAGKGIQLWIEPGELDAIMTALRPEGVWLGIHGIHTREDGEALLKKTLQWT